MSDQLTHEHIKQLEKPFAANEHRFTWDKYAYIDEWALRPRLNSVDPSWSFSINEVIRRDGLKTIQVSVRGTMTIKGVSRSGLGTSDTIGEVKSGKHKGKEYNIEAEKSAATDCLRRCARLFGVGAYLLRAPKFKNVAELDTWLSPNQAPNEQPSPKSEELWILDDSSYAKFTDWCLETIGIEKDEIPIALSVDNRSDYKFSKDMAQAHVIAYAGDFHPAVTRQILGRVYRNGDTVARIGTLVDNLIAEENNNGAKATVVDGAKYMQGTGDSEFTRFLNGDKDTGIILGSRELLRSISPAMKKFVNRWKTGETYRFSVPLLVRHTGSKTHSISEDVLM